MARGSSEWLEIALSQFVAEKENRSHNAAVIQMHCLPYIISSDLTFAHLFAGLLPPILALSPKSIEP